MQERRNSGINQNPLEDKQLNFGQPDFTSHPFWPRKMKARCKKSERQSSVNSSNSSWTEEIFHNALENKGPEGSCAASPSKEAYPVDSRNISCATITCDRNLQFDSTQDECSFYSQARSDLNQNNFVFMPEQPKGFSPSPFSKQQTPLFKMPADNQFCF